MTGTTQDWPGIQQRDKERFYFPWMEIDATKGTVRWEIAVKDETEREALTASHVRTLDDLEKTALADFKVDLIYTALERDEVWK